MVAVKLRMQERSWASNKVSKFPDVAWNLKGIENYHVEEARELMLI